MEIEEKKQKGVCVLVVRGRISMGETDAFEAAIRKVEGVSKQFVVDLSEVSYICSMALGALIASRRRLMRTGGEMRIVAKSGDVLDVLRLTMIDKVILVEASIEKALASFLNRLSKLKGSPEDGSKA